MKTDYLMELEEHQTESPKVAVRPSAFPPELGVEVTFQIELR